MKGIVGRPSTGMRLSVTLVDENDADDADVAPDAFVYRGAVHLPATDVVAEARVARPPGAVRVELGEGGTPEMEKWAAALLRATTKAPLAAGAALPRKIVRWRP